jgi:hypothetical protein
VESGRSGIYDSVKDEMSVEFTRITCQCNSEVLIE